MYHNFIWSETETFTKCNIKFIWAANWCTVTFCHYIYPAAIYGFFKSVQLATKKLAISYVAESLKYVTCMLNRSGYGTESRS